MGLPRRPSALPLRFHVCTPPPPLVHLLQSYGAPLHLVKRYRSTLHAILRRLYPAVGELRPTPKPLRQPRHYPALRFPVLAEHRPRWSFEGEWDLRIPAHLRGVLGTIGREALVESERECECERQRGERGRAMGRSARVARVERAAEHGQLRGKTADPDHVYHRLGDQADARGEDQLSRADAMNPS